MDQSGIREALRGLRQEASAASGSDPEDRARIEELISDLERQSLQPDDVALQSDLQQRVLDTIREFEATHPHFTAALGQLMAALSNTGI